MRLALVAMLLLGTALAGCAEGGGPAPVDEDEQKFDDIDVADDKGAIRGIVLDPSIVPIEGATVAIQSQGLEATSNADGAFTFTDLEPGTYFLEVTKVGYTATQTSVDVQAGIDTPPIVKIQIIRDIAATPYFSAQVWSGFMNCQVGFDLVAASNAVNPCTLLNLASEGADRITIRYDVDRTPTFAQSEMIWEDSQPAGGAMTLQYTRSDGLTGLDNYSRQCGSSPLMVNADEALLTEKGVGIDDNLLVRVFTASCEPLTVVLQQEFEVFTHLFYGFAPPEGYLFLEDGAPVAPS